ncbi:hypothetical protein CC1G_07301 [Coprinopsis cinerea okayama7|uniref:Sphingolipid long chain base-responsive protein LSP1 n=1 Tax=Coprinopsis cinerea (strain Okayama-7 / 130 / ATCC MYA-4618 / FGSC 9003) TaxID=240176 RepID=A8NNN1_COPC7|nr:hypothetical protein CC1G_07301 [Coprinopsis cinerea okayama7\|eukprot:XP_001835159.2 hypothetical protein CC1G_07301 [Coprinopsis cinerea okayama7\
MNDCETHLQPDLNHKYSDNLSMSEPRGSEVKNRRLLLHDCGGDDDDGECNDHDENEDMFKSAATKIAHNTTIPSLGGNADLRPLQDLITLEKSVLISLQKLSSDYTKAADALKIWGQTEGDDLGNILTASGNLLLHFSTALSQYAAHGHVIRENLKSIRSREEALDEMRRRRRTVSRKADDAERKLSKMNPEHKNFDSQTDLLNRLKDEIRVLDSDIMTEEAAIGDYKRSCTRTWMGLKFGGLLECCEKGKIAGEFGKLLISEIPEEFTQPGMPRSMYYGHGKVESIMNEADRCIGQVSLSATPGPRQGPPPQLAPQAQDFNVPRPTINTLPLPPKGPNRGLDSPATTSAPYNVDEFGAPTISTPIDTTSPGGRFATFPVKHRQDSYPPPGSFLSGPEPPSLTTRHELGDSFSLSIAEALEAKTGTEDVTSSWRGRLSGEANLPPPEASPLPKIPPAQDNPWAAKDDRLLSADKRPTSPISDDDNALLAYMTSVDNAPSSPESAQAPLPETKKEPENQKPSSPAPPNAPAPVPALEIPPPEEGSPEKHVRIKSTHVEIINNDDEPPEEPEKKSTIHRVPAPTLGPEEERALDAAAARGINLDLDNGFTPPKLSFPGNDEEDSKKPDAEPSDTTDRGRSTAAGGQAANESVPEREPSPLEPPSAPFARREVSPQASFDNAVAESIAKDFRVCSIAWISQSLRFAVSFARLSYDVDEFTSPPPVIAGSESG